MQGVDYETFRRECGAVLARMRKKEEISQKELAQQLDIGQSELCSFEKCKRQLSMHVICRAFRLLGYELKIILEKVEE